MTPLLLPLVAAVTPASANPAPAAATEPPLAIRLTPRVAAGIVRSIDVRLSFPAPPADATGPLLSMSLVRVMAPSTLTDPAGLTARDALGELPLEVETAPVDPSGFEQARTWRPRRVASGEVIVTYSARPREITPATRPGPLYDTRTEGAGFYGSGSTLLAMPVAGWPRRVAIDWDLAEMPGGSRGISSLGEGRVAAVLERDDLLSTLVMAGPVQSHPQDGSGGFIVYWLTPPAFDLLSASRWTERAYAYFQQVFGARERPFRVFMRTTDRFQGGGSGGFSSFIFGAVAGQARDPEDLRGLLAHEALHSFTGGGGTGRQWYSEGSTSYYTAILPWRAGLASLDEVQESFNDLARAYYTNPRSNLSNDEVTRLFFSDSDAQVVPYQRGPLYFALVDARLRAASGGRRRVDELVRRYIARPGEADPVGYWRELVREALGEPGAAEFDAMMAGGPLDLPEDLLGPCFRGERRLLSRFNLGFRAAPEADGRAYVRQLRPGSAAEAAGVREGDVVRNAAMVETARSAAEGSRLELELTRDGRDLTLGFVPWSEPKPGLQWVRTDIPETGCGL